MTKTWLGLQISVGKRNIKPSYKHTEENEWYFESDPESIELLCGGVEERDWGVDEELELEVWNWQYFSHMTIPQSPKISKSTHTCGNLSALVNMFESFIKDAVVMQGPRTSHRVIDGNHGIIYCQEGLSMYCTPELQKADSSCAAQAWCGSLQVTVTVWNMVGGDTWSYIAAAIYDVDETLTRCQCTPSSIQHTSSAASTLCWKSVVLVLSYLILS